MKDRNVVLGIVSGSSVAAVEAWDAAAPDRIMKGIGIDDPSHFMKPEELDRLFREKSLDAFGEVAAQMGYSPSDPAFDAYWAVAAKHGVPVGIHTGGAPPRTPYTCCPKFRLTLGDPLLLEDMLVTYPTLKGVRYARRRLLSGARTHADDDVPACLRGYRGVELDSDRRRSASNPSSGRRKGGACSTG